MYINDVFEPRVFQGKGEVEINGEKISYHTVSEDNVFYSEDGKMEASIFSFSYFRDDVENIDTRPVIFGFNGGPGTSSTMVHLGLLGPKRIAYKDNIDDENGIPPFTVIDNPECLLDIADLVLVDPVSTGFGVLIDQTKGEKYYGIEEDAEAFLCFVQRWLSKYKRWLSPKYILGESYGCTRASVAAGLSVTWRPDRNFDISFDGIIFIGNTVTTGKYFNREVPAEPAVLGFPTYAAINWYHNTDHSVPLDSWVKEAKEFADSVYNLALYRGSKVIGKEREELKAKIRYYTGVSDEYLEKRDLKVEDGSFRSEVIKEKGKAVSRLDARMTRPFSQPFTEEEKDGWLIDASRGKYNAYFLSALQGGVFPTLGIDNIDRPYVNSSSLSQKWNKEAKNTTAGHLYNAMLRVEGMRCFFANGYFDMATEIGVAYYMLDHAHLPLDRVSIKGYPSGHMIYIGNENIKNLVNDIRVFLSGKKPE